MFGGRGGGGNGGGGGGMGGGEETCIREIPATSSDVLKMGGLLRDSGFIDAMAKAAMDAAAVESDSGSRVEWAALWLGNRGNPKSNCEEPSGAGATMEVEEVEEDRPDLIDGGDTVLIRLPDVGGNGVKRGAISDMTLIVGNLLLF